MKKKKGNGKESEGDLDLREKAVVAARTEEEVDGVVGGVVAVAEANIGRSAADGRPATAVVRAAIPHALPFAVHEKRGRVGDSVLFNLKRSTTNKQTRLKRESINTEQMRESIASSCLSLKSCRREMEKRARRERERG